MPLDLSAFAPVDQASEGGKPGLDLSGFKPLDLSGFAPIEPEKANPDSNLGADPAPIEAFPDPAAIALKQARAEPPTEAPPLLAGDRSAEVEAMAQRAGQAPQTPDDALRRLPPAVERGARSARQGMAVLGAEIGAQPGPTATVQAQLDAYGAIDRGEPHGADPGTVVGNRARMYEAASPEARQRLRARAEGQLREFTEAGRKAAESAGETIAAQEARIQEIPPPESVVRFNESKTFGEAWSRFLEAPAEITLTLIGESAAPSAISLIGGIAGLPAGPVGMAAGVGAGSFATEYASKFLDAFKEAGVDVTRPGAVATALSDPLRMAEIRDKAALKGLGVAAFDALSAGFAGKLVHGAKGVRSFIGRGAGELAMQAGAGAAGEASGSLLAGEEINPAAVLAEAIAEVPGGVGETAMGAHARRGQPEPVVQPSSTLDYRGFEPVGPEATQGQPERPVGGESPPAGEPAAGKGTEGGGATATTEPGNASPPAPRSIDQIEEDLSLFRAALEEDGVSDTEKQILERAIAETEAERAAARGDGTKSNPVVVETREDIARAEAQVNTEPTDGQKEAGNYKKGHIEFQGLPIALEQPAGSIRRGVGEDGKPWEAEMPVPYGYDKGVFGNDGDKLDVYLGPNPMAPEVFIVNQTRPGVRRLDEHKVMLGFDSMEEAQATYDAAFSDGSGPERRHSIAEMPMEEYRVWRKDPENKGRFARSFEGDRPGFSLAQELAARGGINDQGDLGDLGKRRLSIAGVQVQMRGTSAKRMAQGLAPVSRLDGMGWDDAAKVAHGLGFIDNPDVDELKAALSKDLEAHNRGDRGRRDRVYSREDEAAQRWIENEKAKDEGARWQAAERSRLVYAAEQVAVDHRKYPINADLEKAIEARDREIEEAEHAARVAVQAVQEEADGEIEDLTYTDSYGARSEAAPDEGPARLEAVPGSPEEIDDGDRAEREALPQDDDKGVKPKETFQEQIARLRKRRDDHAARLKADLEKNGRVVFDRGNGRRAVVTKSVDPDYEWRLTWFDGKDPTGHLEFKNFDELARETIGEYRDAPAVDQTDQGPQNVIPGAEKKTAAEVKDAKAEAAQKKKAEEKRVEGAQSKLRRGNQKSLADQDGGMFSSERDQKTMLMVQPPYYSALEEALPKLPAKGTGQQMLATLKNTQGVKEGEIVAIGLDQWLPQQDKVTREEVAEFVRQHKVDIVDVQKSDERGRPPSRQDYDAMWAWLERQNDFSPPDDQQTLELAMGGDRASIGELEGFGAPDDLLAPFRDFAGGEGGTKFSSYTLPGGTNYREVLLTLPARSPDAAIYARLDRLQIEEYDARARGDEAEAARLHAEAVRIAGKRTVGDPTNDFRGGHFEEPNVLAHIRLNDRTDADGKRVLFVEEIQSDWMQLHRRQTAAIEKAVASDFDGIVAQMKRDGVLTEVCD